jgi:membrane fusion protein, multidrug efflux system
MRRLLFFAIFLLLAAGCQPKQRGRLPVNITAFRLEPHTIPANFAFVGVAKSSHQVEIRSRVEGYLTAIDYVEGSMVAKDTLLFQIDHRPFLASLQQAEGALARQEAVLWRAKKSLERIEPLYKQNAASQRDYDDAIAQVLTAEATVIEAQANVIQAKLNLSYTYITSPIDGWSGRAFFREGTLITPSVNGLLTYVDIIDPIWVYFSVSDNELLQAKAEGSAATLILPEEQNYTVSLVLADGSTFPHTGEVNFTSPILDPQTATMTVRAQFANPQGVLLPSQFVRATISGAFRPNALFVPQESVFQGRQGMYVFVIGPDQTVSIRGVQIGAAFENYWIIKSGLEVGEEVVVNGVNKLLEGSKVNILSSAPSSLKFGVGPYAKAPAVERLQVGQY